MNICYGCMTQKPDNTKKCPNCGHINNQEQKEHYYLPEGTTLNDRYMVGGVLGHGGFGITYIGLDTKLDTRVAIKEYLPSDISTRALGETTVSTFSGDKYDEYVYGLGRFIDEAKTLAKYNSHQCIVYINDYFKENNTAYLVMEYLDGISLGEYVKRSGGRITIDETLSVMRPVMDALREVHANGMIHRDVSPDNIFITKDMQVKLLDFGAARHAMSEKSKSLSVVLKPGYAPPEQYYTKGQQGSWTDVYAVAATMYKCITGSAPPEAMERVLADSIVYPDSIDKNIASAIIKALNVTVDNRYKDIGEFAEQLYYSDNAQSQNETAVSRSTEELKQPVQHDEESKHKDNIKKKAPSKGKKLVNDLNKTEILMNKTYNWALNYIKSGDLSTAESCLEGLRKYKQSHDLVEDIESKLKQKRYKSAIKAYEKGDMSIAQEYFEKTKGYKKTDYYLNEIEANRKRRVVKIVLAAIAAVIVLLILSC